MSRGWLVPFECVSTHKVQTYVCTGDCIVFVGVMENGDKKKETERFVIFFLIFFSIGVMPFSLSACLSIHCPSDLCIHACMGAGMHPFIQFSVCWFVCLSVWPSTCPPICPSVPLSAFCQSAYLSVHLSIYPSACLPACLSAHPSLSTRWQSSSTLCVRQSLCPLIVIVAT